MPPAVLMSTRENNNKQADRQRKARRLAALHARGLTEQDHLVLASVAGSTLAAYMAAVVKLREWGTLRGVEWDFMDAADMWDLLLASYGRYLFHNGRPLYLFKNAVFGVELMEGLQGHLRMSRSTLKGWQSLEQSQKAPPMPEDFAAMVALTAALMGGPPQGMAILVAFDAYLRSSEVAGLRVSDVNFIKDERAVLRIRASKTGRDQSAQVRHPQVILALRALVCNRLHEVGKEGSLFNLPSGQVYARAFKRWVQALSPGIRIPFVPHSLRHGGATRDFLAGVEVARIQQYGRWRDPKSALHYIQNCPALLQLQHIPAAILTKGASFWPQMGAIFTDLLGFQTR